MLNPSHFTQISQEHRRRALICQKDSISPHAIPTANNSDNGKNRWKRVDHCRAEYEHWWSHSGRALEDTITCWFITAHMSNSCHQNTTESCYGLPERVMKCTSWCELAFFPTSTEYLGKLWF